MRLRIRRALILGGVALSVALGFASIQVAAALTAAAAPPPAPPISLSELKSQLGAEQARSAALQAQLDELTQVTAQLDEAVGATSDEVSLDGLTAKQLRARLLAAQKRLDRVSALLRQAEARLAGGGTRGGSTGTSRATPKPVAAQPTQAPGGAQAPPAPTPAPTRRPRETPEPRPTPEPIPTPEPQH